jgi:hypothetical protein
VSPLFFPTFSTLSFFNSLALSLSRYVSIFWFKREKKEKLVGLYKLVPGCGMRRELLCTDAYSGRRSHTQAHTVWSSSSSRHAVNNQSPRWGIIYIYIVSID